MLFGIKQVTSTTESLLLGLLQKSKLKAGFSHTILYRLIVADRLHYNGNHSVTAFFDGLDNGVR